MVGVAPEQRTVCIVHAAFFDLARQYHRVPCHGSKTPDSGPTASTMQIRRKQAAPSQQSQGSQYTDASISLSGWTPSQQLPPSLSSRPATLPSTADTAQTASGASLKDANKARLKRLLLLGLRHAGITKQHRDFASTWKHLYCACVFAMRKELAVVEIDQPTMLAVIRNNMTFLNVK